LDDGHDVGGRNGSAHQVALNLIAQDSGQEFRLGLGFDPLGDHSHAQAAGQLDHAAD
jgi:hypothetical protein